jgi:hypothetical protein
MRIGRLYLGTLELLLSSTALTIPFSSPVSAACTPSDDDETIYCQGESNVLYGNTYTNMQITNVPSSSSGPFILGWVGDSPDGNGVPGGDANYVTLTFDGTGSTISGTQYNISSPHAVVAVDSTGGDGSSGNHDTNDGDAKSWDGGDGGNAFDATIVFSAGTITVTDETDDMGDLSLITALSIGGNGGPSNDAHSVIGGTARGGEGGLAGNSNAAAITIDSARAGATTIIALTIKLDPSVGADQAQVAVAVTQPQMLATRMVVSVETGTLAEATELPSLSKRERSPSTAPEA